MIQMPYPNKKKTIPSHVIASSDAWETQTTPTSDEIEIMRLRSAIELILDLLLADFPRSARCIAEEVLTDEEDK